MYSKSAPTGAFQLLKNLTTGLLGMDATRGGGEGSDVSNGKTRASPAPKYRSTRNPELTWSGRGGAARWLLAEMEESKKPIDHFLIK
jgi:DNA-binding protein H-NS